MGAVRGLQTECLGHYPSLDEFLLAAVDTLVLDEGQWLLGCLDLARVRACLESGGRYRLRERGGGCSATPCARRDPRATRADGIGSRGLDFSRALRRESGPAAPVTAWAVPGVPPPPRHGRPVDRLRAVLACAREYIAPRVVSARVRARAASHGAPRHEVVRA